MLNIHVYVKQVCEILMSNMSYWNALKNLPAMCIDLSSICLEKKVLNVLMEYIYLKRNKCKFSVFFCLRHAGNFITLFQKVQKNYNFLVR